MSERPLVSVIIPVRNAQRFLPEALGDVTSQTYRNLDIVVVNGHSTDRTVEIANSFPGVRVVEQAGDGLPDAWNVGIDAAEGDPIAFLDSDDRWTPDKIELQMAAFDRDPRVDFVIAHARFFLEPGEPCPPRFNPDLLERSHVANMPSALLARRKVFETIGNFPTDFEIASDIDWFARLKDSDLVRAVIPEVLVRKRVHDTNLSYTADSARGPEVLRVLRESVARQRRRR